MLRSLKRFVRFRVIKQLLRSPADTLESSRSCIIAQAILSRCGKATLSCLFTMISHSFHKLCIMLHLDMFPEPFPVLTAFSLQAQVFNLIAMSHLLKNQKLASDDLGC